MSATLNLKVNDSTGASLDKLKGKLRDVAAEAAKALPAEKQAAFNAETVKAAKALEQEGRAAEFLADQQERIARAKAAGNVGTGQSGTSGGNSALRDAVAHEAAAMQAAKQANEVRKLAAAYSGATSSVGRFAEMGRIANASNIFYGHEIQIRQISGVLDKLPAKWLMLGGAVGAVAAGVYGVVKAVDSLEEHGSKTAKSLKIGLEDAFRGAGDAAGSMWSNFADQAAQNLDLVAQKMGIIQGDKHTGESPDQKRARLQAEKNDRTAEEIRASQSEQAQEQRRRGVAVQADAEQRRQADSRRNKSLENANPETVYELRKKKQREAADYAARNPETQPGGAVNPGVAAQKKKNLEELARLEEEYWKAAENRDKKQAEYRKTTDDKAKQEKEQARQTAEQREEQHTQKITQLGFDRAQKESEALKQQAADEQKLSDWRKQHKLLAAGEEETHAKRQADLEKQANAAERAAWDVKLAAAKDVYETRALLLDRDNKMQEDASKAFREREQRKTEALKEESEKRLKEQQKLIDDLKSALRDQLQGGPAGGAAGTGQPGGAAVGGVAGGTGGGATASKISKTEATRRAKMIKAEIARAKKARDKQALRQLSTPNLRKQFIHRADAAEAKKQAESDAKRQAQKTVDAKAKQDAELDRLAKEQADARNAKQPQMQQAPQQQNRPKGMSAEESAEWDRLNNPAKGGGNQGGNQANNAAAQLGKQTVQTANATANAAQQSAQLAQQAIQQLAQIEQKMNGLSQQVRTVASNYRQRAQGSGNVA